MPALICLLLLLCNGYATSEDLLQHPPAKRLGLYPSLVNLAASAGITANATCGQEGPERYCRLVQHHETLFRRRKRRSHCDVCDATNLETNHDIKYAIDGIGRRWWQSPTINNGYNYNWVTISLDLKQVFQVAYFILKAGDSPRPGNWILEKSLDGVAFQPWQYFAMTNQECRDLYPGNRVTGFGAARMLYDSEVTCTPYFSKIEPLKNGEIHISLINERPSAGNPSEELIRFTSARYVRLRFQRIHTLLGDLMSHSRDAIDPVVTKRYYYSVKDISIGGMCICHGHAHDCPSNPFDGKFVCKCEHQTTGDNCEQCLPMYNQHRWRPGNAGFECEECNCHGHASSCYYDENVERRKESLNRRGMRIGGGVCVGCRDYTTGVNCESCKDGYFRPADVDPNGRFPCQRCVCNRLGSRTTPDGMVTCVKSLEDGRSSGTMHPGDCYCKDGFTGANCDQCEFGFTGFPNCKPCPCNVAGSVNSDPCLGDCICKENVMGVHCDECKSGFYDLTRSSDKGCSECYCSGMSMNCASASLFRNVLTAPQGWDVSDRYGAHKTRPLYDQTLNEPYIQHSNATANIGNEVYYWSAPDSYLGDKLSSYGGDIRYKIYYELPLLDYESQFFNDVDLILEGEELVLEFSARTQVEPFVSTAFTVTLQVGTGWVEANTRSPATKNQLLHVLSRLHRLLIRAPYNHEGQALFRIRDVEMDTATPDGGGARVMSVEKCHCPLGFYGLSCEDCAPGFYRKGKRCVECQCSGKSRTCDLETGVCEHCRNSSIGRNCEWCLPGYFKDAAGDCQRCACPLTVSSNNFSPTCVFDALDSVTMCQSCPEGYSGQRCERCSPGYYGDPTVPGQVCRKCECNGNSERCDALTGICLACGGNSSGPHCQHCAIGYYGDAVAAKNCKRCACDARGSVYRNCNPVTGQCSCRSNVRGLRCDRCEADQFLDRNAKACVSCACNAVGSTTTGCDASGRCSCQPGVTGPKCDRCLPGYYGFGRSGCRKCDCPHTNGICNPANGTCACPTLTTGYRCGECEPGSYGWNSQVGCKECSCHLRGSKATQCGLMTGMCQCKDGYDGTRCDQCRDGHHRFPDCSPCDCHASGTVTSSCDDGSCACDYEGQCQCRDNAAGLKCDRCAPKSFSMQAENPKGCTECFCFGVTDDCVQARYHWGEKIVMSDPMEIVVSLSALTRVALANRFNTRSTTNGVLMSASSASIDPAVVKRSLGFTLYYWRLPPQFNGNKLLSYGGKLSFAVYFIAKLGTSPYAGSPSVVMRGRHSSSAIGYRLPEPEIGQSTEFSVSMRESGWTYVDSNRPVQRADFMMTIRDIDYLMVKASYGSMIVQSRLSDVTLDIATEGPGDGRGDASTSSNGPLAYGVEECSCPPGYAGLSCQICDRGYTRIQTGIYLGECRPCACNGKSDTCDADSGRCLNCRDHFEGDRCDRCRSGYYMRSTSGGLVCEKCACPLPSVGNSYSRTCRPIGLGETYVCDKCFPGYEGPHCERCSPGYYGSPGVPGNRCKKCGCNPSGSRDQNCHSSTGQCNCVSGVTGRICDRCRPKHAITEDGCIKCDQGCVGDLLHAVEHITEEVRSVKFENMLPPPWSKLMRVGNASSDLQVDVDKSMTGIVDSMTSVDVAFDKMRPITAIIDNSVAKSYACYLDGSVTVRERNAREDSILEKLTVFDKVLNESKAVSANMQSLVERMGEGIDFDGMEVTSRMVSMVSEMKSRKMSRYAAKAKRELKLARKFLERVTRDFVEKVQRRRSDSFPILSNTTQIVKRKLADLRVKIRIATRLVERTDSLNDMNAETIRQLSAEIESLGNNISIVVNMKNMSMAGVVETRNARVRTRTIISEIQEQSAALKVTLEELKRESDKKAVAQMQLIMFGDLTRTAQNKTRAFEIESEHAQQNADIIRRMTRDVREAVTRYEEIDGIITAAGLESDTAQRLLASASLPELDLGEYSEIQAVAKRTRKSMQEKKRQIQILKSRAVSKNETAEQLRGNVSNIRIRLQNINDHAYRGGMDTALSIGKEANRITKQVLEGVQQKESTASDLQDDLNTANQNKTIIEQISSTIKSSPDILNATATEVAAARKKQTNVKALSDHVRGKITELRRQIEESRMKAGYIQAASVKSQGECVMKYAPKLKPSRITEIVLRVMPEARDNTLFYAGHIDQGDYILVYSQNGLVHVSWDLGSGQGNLVNPVYAVKNGTKSEDWFQIEIVRKDQELNATVFAMSNKSATVRSVVERSDGDAVVLNINESDMMYVGGVPDELKLPKDVPVHSYTGCFGYSSLQRKPIGLWNFREISDKAHCASCGSPPVEESSNRVYGFNGKSYSLVQLHTRMFATNVNIVDLTIRTVNADGILVYMGASISTDFLLIELVDGRVVAHIDLGTGVNTLRSEKKYNDGEWFGLRFSRFLGRVRITMKDRINRVEHYEVIIDGSDGHLNMSNDDLVCVGGCPSDRILEPIAQKDGFIGCLRDFRLWNRRQHLAGAWNVLRFSQVERTCPEMVSRDIGITEGGFVEIPGHSLPVAGSVSITFNSREPDAILMLATDESPTTRRRKRRHTKTNFYSLTLREGHIEARLRAVSGEPLVLRSALSSYSDGAEHTALLKREGDLIQLIVDDNVASIVSGKLARGGRLQLETSRLYVGGVPDSVRVRDMAGSVASLQGCVREVIANGPIDFHNFTRVAKSYLGTCAHTPTIPFLRRRRDAAPTEVSTSPVTSTIPPYTPSSVAPSALVRPSSSVSVIDITSPPINTAGCAAEGQLATLRASNRRFGLSPYSHMRFAIDENISARFRMQIEFRTHASHGLLLYGASDAVSDYFSLQLNNGVPVFRFDCGKGPGEAKGNQSLSDGEWHTVRLSRSKRKGFLKIDNVRYDIGRSPKGANRLDIEKTLYVGGLDKSLDACVRSLSVNKAKMDLRKPAASSGVGLCYKNSETGAYFAGDGYAVYNNQYRVGPTMNIEMEFRTWALDGVLVSISNSGRSDGLALELVNGTIFFRVDNGGGDIVTRYSPKLHGAELCDGEWHKIKATKQHQQLTLTVDGLYFSNPRSSVDDQKSADTSDPLYIGGYPDGATAQKQLTTKTKFRGCIRKVKLKGQNVDFSQVFDYKGIHPNSCPKSHRS